MVLGKKDWIEFWGIFWFGLKSFMLNLWNVCLIEVRDRQMMARAWMNQKYGKSYRYKFKSLTKDVFLLLRLFYHRKCDFCLFNIKVNDCFAWVRGEQIIIWVWLIEKNGNFILLMYCFSQTLRDSMHIVNESANKICNWTKVICM